MKARKEGGAGGEDRARGPRPTSSTTRLTPSAGLRFPSARACGPRPSGGWRSRPGARSGAGGGARGGPGARPAPPGEGGGGRAQDPGSGAGDAGPEPGAAEPQPPGPGERSGAGAGGAGRGRGCSGCSGCSGHAGPEADPPCAAGRPPSPQSPPWSHCQPGPRLSHLPRGSSRTL